MRSRLLASALLTAALAAPAFAATADSVSTDDIKAQIKSVKAADYPSANTVLVYSTQAVVFQDDGQFTNTVHSTRLVLTPAGKADAATASLYYTKDAELMEVVSAQVIKADGTIVPVAKKDIQDTEQSGEANIYDPQGRAVKITFANIAVGDAVDFSYRLTRKLPTRPGFFNDIYSFQGTEPVLNASYAVDGPKDKPLTAEIYHPERSTKITSTKDIAGDRVHYKWSATKEAQIVPESSMNFSTEMPMLVVTTNPSWQDFSKWWADVTKPQMDITPELKAKADELVKGKTTDADKIKALYDFVSTDVRYRGLGVGPRTGYTPRKASETYASRWGVCRDVSILLTTLLRSEGYEAYPVLTNVGDPVLPKVAYDGFNHAIVAMPNKSSGGWTYLDPTAKNMHDMLPGYEAEQNTLVSTDKGEPLTQIPAFDPGQNLGHAVATSTLNADGSLTSKVVVETKGVFDLIVRGAAASMSKDQQREEMEMVVHHAFPDAQLISYDISSALALFTPMSITIELKVPNAAVKTGDKVLLRTLVTSGSLGLVEAALPLITGGAPSRKFGLDAHLTFEYDQDETVTLAPGTTVVALPNPASTSNGTTSLDATCTQKDPTTLVCHRGFALKSRFIQPTAYTQLRDAVAMLGRVAHQPVILGGAK
ncbi:MAG TPA: DUF3857 and transglutaminase domain-containing protein [Kofleriaceae bacterium]|jgi:hypothetical protein